MSWRRGRGNGTLGCQNGPMFRLGETRIECLITLLLLNGEGRMVLVIKWCNTFTTSRSWPAEMAAISCRCTKLMKRSCSTVGRTPPLLVNKGSRSDSMWVCGCSGTLRELSSCSTHFTTLVVRPSKFDPRRLRARNLSGRLHLVLLWPSLSTWKHGSEQSVHVMSGSESAQNSETFNDF